MLSASDEAEALELLHSNGSTDGLPVVIPTQERVNRMVLASGQDPEANLGTMGPAHGVATIEKVAVAAVMAGMVRDYLKNATVAGLLRMDPTGVSDAAIAGASRWTQVKAGGTSVAFVLLLIACAVVAVRRFKAR